MGEKVKMTWLIKRRDIDEK